MVKVGLSTALAIPKSVRTTRSSGPSRILAGFTSRCTMSSRRYYLPGAATRGRGLSAAGGGSVAAIASAVVSRIAAHAVMTAMTILRNN